MKTFIHILQNRLLSKYTDTQFVFYVLRRNKHVNMELDESILSYKQCYDVISDISQIWKGEKQDDL